MFRAPHTERTGQGAQRACLDPAGVYLVTGAGLAAGATLEELDGAVLTAAAALVAAGAETGPVRASGVRV